MFGFADSRLSNVFWVIALITWQDLASAQESVAVVSQTASFGSLVPSGLGAPAIIALPFRLSIPAAVGAGGYKLTAVSNFVFSPSRPSDGGKSITAADIGVGLATPRGAGAEVAVAEGFDYDPAVAKGANGSSHYAGAAAGRANLADLLTGREILRVGKRAAGNLAAGTTDLTLIVRMAVQPQFLTPGGFSGTITLTVAETR